ncbi:MAG TPA: aminoacyl-tRNA hydrolase [Vicinamibacterales bacterium]|nr:aminoacyl-tRNA hydrolase [Vicinamibacterales bacterium]
MKLVAGLGNPGGQYRSTRHNVGFEVVDAVLKRHRLWWNEAKMPGPFMELRWRRADGDVLFVRPLTFMNLSGDAVSDRMRFYKIDLLDVLIVADDVNLPLGRLRARASGSEGGHNGLRSIAESLGTIDYARLRIGVGRGDLRRDLADHVLARFEPDEQTGVEDAIARAADAVEVWISDGLARVMNTFNRAEDNA